MKEVHLIKAAQIKPFVELLKDKGAAVDQYSRQTGLPLEQVLNETGVIGEFCAWKFIELAAKSENYDTLGYDSAQLNPITTPSDLGGFHMRYAQNLSTLLNYFIEDAQKESTGTNYILREDTHAHWFTREQMFGKENTSWQVEQYMIAVIIQIVRICAGKDWLPDEIRVSSTELPQALPNEWTGCRVGWGYETTEIKIPNTILALAPLEDRPFIDKNKDIHSNTVSSDLDLINLIKSQIHSKRINLESISQQTGLSPKTLKRRLSSMDTSFTQIIENTKIEIARKKLSEEITPIAKIADELGYQHAANFTRAFKRLCGVSPQQYRNTFQN